MTNYILLRGNKESGPYSLQDLRFYGISFSDLIWVEGESTVWRYPADISELAALASEGQKRTIPKRLEVSQPHASFGSEVSENHLEIQNGSRTYVPDHISIYSSRKPAHKNPISFGSGLFGFTVLLIGAGFCAFVVKKMVDGFDDSGFSATAEAKTIQETVLTPSTSAHPAKMTNSVTLVQTAYYPAVATTESTPKKASISKTSFRKLPAAQRTPLANDEPILNGGSLEPSIIKQPSEEVFENEKEEVPPPPKPVSSLQVSSNDYSVGVFGGISNLVLSVANPSSQIIEKAVVEVEFLKPNGSVVRSQTISVENISPGGSKKIAVPSSNRGVKVRYKVIGIQPDAK